MEAKEGVGNAYDVTYDGKTVSVVLSKAKALQLAAMLGSVAGMSTLTGLYYSIPAALLSEADSSDEDDYALNNFDYNVECEAIRVNDDEYVIGIYDTEGSPANISEQNEAVTLSFSIDEAKLCAAYILCTGGTCVLHKIATMITSLLGLVRSTFIRGYIANRQIILTSDMQGVMYMYDSPPSRSQLERIPGTKEYTEVHNKIGELTPVEMSKIIPF